MKEYWEYEEDMKRDIPSNDPYRKPFEPTKKEIKAMPKNWKTIGAIISLVLPAIVWSIYPFLHFENALTIPISWSSICAIYLIYYIA